MLKTLHKSILIAWLLILCCSQIVHAETKLYRYDGKLPFVQMMLNMMAAMGILDRLPASGAYGGYGLSGLSNPYARALAMRGMSPGLPNSGFGNNPLMSSPWLQTPWSSSTLNNSNVNSASPVWGSPSWGVLPSDSYASNNYSMYDPYGTSSIWSASDLDGWVNETWETSQWNPKAEMKTEAPGQATQPQLAQPSAPLVQNFNYNVPAKTTNKAQQRTRQRTSKQSPLSKLAQVNRPMGQQRARQSDRAPAKQQRKQSPLYKKTRPAIKQKPCVTDFCGLKKPNLNGLWVAQNGEMFGVKDKRYLWSDSNSRYLTGQLLIQNEYLLANVDGHEKVMRYKYKLAGNHLLTLKPDGTIREFVRMPANQYYSQR